MNTTKLFPIPMMVMRTRSSSCFHYNDTTQSEQTHEEKNLNHSFSISFEKLVRIPKLLTLVTDIATYLFRDKSSDAAHPEENPRSILEHHNHRPNQRIQQNQSTPPC